MSLVGKIFRLKKPIPGKPEVVEVLDDDYLVKYKSEDGNGFIRKEKFLKWYYGAEGLQREMFPKPKPFDNLRSKVKLKFDDSK